MSFAIGIIIGLVLGAAIGYVANGLLSANSNIEFTERYNRDE